jgi:hypothetical protein
MLTVLSTYLGVHYGHAIRHTRDADDPQRSLVPTRPDACEDKGTGNRDKGSGNRDKGTDNRDIEGTGNRDKGTDNRDITGTGNRDKGTGNRDKGSRSRPLGH